MQLTFTGGTSPVGAARSTVDDDDDDGCEGVKMREGPAVAATEVSVGSRPLTWAHLG